MESVHEIDGVFSEIYSRNLWGGPGGSGPGSESAYVRPIRDKLVEYIKLNNIKSILDVGCGFVGWMSEIDWNSLNCSYLGIDVVLSVIEKNVSHNNIMKFKLLNLLTCDQIDIPKADLVFCKDMLQHLPNNYVIEILKIIKQFNHIILCNCCVDEISFQRSNLDIKIGEWRSIKLFDKPFEIKGKLMLRHKTKEMIEVMY